MDILQTTWMQIGLSPDILNGNDLFVRLILSNDLIDLVIQPSIPLKRLLLRKHRHEIEAIRLHSLSVVCSPCNDNFKHKECIWLAMDMFHTNSLNEHLAPNVVLFINTLKWFIKNCRIQNWRSNIRYHQGLGQKRNRTTRRFALCYY